MKLKFITIDHYIFEIASILGLPLIIGLCVSLCVSVGHLSSNVRGDWGEIFLLHSMQSSQYENESPFVVPPKHKN